MIYLSHSNQQLFIDNEFVDARSGKTYANINPSNGAVIAQIAEGDSADIDAAVEAAQRAFARGSEWRNLDNSKRGLLLFRLADLIERDATHLANLETLDNGKAFGDALADVGYSVDAFRYYAGYADKIHGKTVPSDYGLYSMTRREPVGIVGQIIPWNYPLLMLAWKWAPALAAGCVSILKPAELTPLTALYVAALTKEAGFPAGVVAVIPGYGPTAGHALAAHPHVAKLAFTGSVPVGKKVMEVAAKTNLKRVSLELGGKSPLVVFDDADVNEAADIAHTAIFMNHGQNCVAGSRTFVHEDIYDRFVKRATELAKKRTVGDPFADGVQQGPQIDERSLTKILGYIAAGQREGAKLETGGKRIGTSGFFVEPTVFSNVTDDMSIAREEVGMTISRAFTFTVSIYVRIISLLLRRRSLARFSRSSSSKPLRRCCSAPTRRTLVWRPV